MKSTGAKQAIMGNRTGIQTSPELAEELIEGASNAIPSSEGGPTDIAVSRGEYIAEGFPIGSLPTMPLSKEAEASEDEAGLAVLLDKLSERLAFERTGTRLYEALLNKCEILGEPTPGPNLEDIQKIGREELEHFLLLNRVVTELGGDPTVESPSADMAAVSSMGIMQVLTDPRSSMTQCLEALLIAELTDNDGWELLIKLADSLGFQQMKAEFQTALENEQEHLQNVRTWVEECVLESAQV